MKKFTFLATLIILFSTVVSVKNTLAGECEQKFSGVCQTDGGPCNSPNQNLGYYGCPVGQFCCGSQQKWSQSTFPTEAGNPSAASGNPSAAGGGNLSISFDPPTKWTTIEQVMNSLMGYLKGIAGTIAVIFIIIGGIMYMFAGANKDMAEKGKHTLTYAIAGLAIVIAAPTFLREIKTILGGDASGIGGLSLIEIAGNVLRLLLSIVGMLAIIMMVIGGIWMFSATGNEKQFETGKSIVTYAIIGLAIAIGSLVIAQQVARLVAG